MPRIRFMPFAMNVSLAVEGMGATGAKGCAPVATWSDEPDPTWQPL